MRQTVETFVCGVITGMLAVMLVGVVFDFQRPVPAKPVVAVPLQPQPQLERSPRPSDPVLEAERLMPLELRACVSTEVSNEYRRQMQRFEDAMRFVLEKAIGSCKATYRPPPSIAQR